MDILAHTVDDALPSCSTGNVDTLRLVTRDHIDFGRVWSSSCCR
ncbi:hypothetical protein [Solihabitans fulvus]|nr:hypothetical protein [Solihabitans fulvus]